MKPGRSGPPLRLPGPLSPNVRSHWCRFVLVFLTLGAGCLVAPPALGIDGPSGAKKTFTQRCTACHTFGKGVKVCADLKGVTGRRTRAWLVPFIRSSQTVIASGDPTATALFQQFKDQRMPDWTDLSEDQVGSLLDWLAADGPDHIDPDDVTADTATQPDIDRGRALFGGGERLANGGVACAACHQVHGPGSGMGGNLGPDLTRVYLKYGDRALGTFIKHPCFRRWPDSAADPYLTAQETFALRAYLRLVALLDAQRTGGGR
jgi:mono/diheme cytochrome c family protein